MSTFLVSVEVIDKVWAHPNADKLDLASVEGILGQFVVRKDSFKPGDAVVYFPVDAILPDNLIKELGMEGKFSGNGKNRVKTIKLRKEISQGYVELLSSPVFFPYLQKAGIKNVMVPVGLDLTAVLGVEKYDYEEAQKKTNSKASHKGPKHLTSHPVGVKTYDLEGYNRHKGVFDYMRSKRVAIFEKIEGTNWYLTSDATGKIIHGQKNFAIKDWDDRTKWEKVVDWFKYKNPFRKGKPWVSPELIDSDFGHKATSKKLNLPDKLKFIKKTYFTETSNVTFRGELIGPTIQQNIYKVTEQDIYMFDILVDGQYLTPDKFISICASSGIKTVPLIAMDVVLDEWLAGRDPLVAINGKSAVVDHLREGLVFKPMVEEYHPKLNGRLVLKHRDAEYLDKTGL